MTTNFQRFETFEAFLGAIAAPRLASAGNSSETNGKSFTHTNSYSEAIDLATNGWTKGREKIARMAMNITKRIANHEHRPEIQFDVTGDCFDMGRVNTGVPECAMVWEQTEVPRQGHKVLTLVVSQAISASIDADVIETRGAAVAALAECLELAGYRVEIVVEMTVAKSFSGNEPVASCAVVVKQSTAPIQIDQLAFTLVHPSMLRRLMFKWQETCIESELSRTLTGGGTYGMPVAPITKGDIVCGQMRSSGDVSEFQSINAVEKWILGILKTQGVTLE